LTRIAIAIVAVFGIAITPAVSQAAVKKFPVDIAFTGLDEEGNIRGQVTSTKAKCVGGVDVFGENESIRMSGFSDDQGNFQFEFGDLIMFDYETFESYVQAGSKWGRRGKKKRCGATRVIQAEINGVDGFLPSVDVVELNFNDVTNTFSGTLDSEDQDCLEGSPLLGLYYQQELDGTFQRFFDRGFTASGSSFSVSYGSQPASTVWEVFVDEDFVGSSSFVDGNASVHYCQAGFWAGTVTP